MKTTADINEERRRLIQLCRELGPADRKTADEAYVMATALQWVVENTSWSPSGMCKATEKEKEKWAQEKQGKTPGTNQRP